MEQSTLHIKVPHELHIALKVKAIQNSTSMNQYLNDLIATDIGKDTAEQTARDISGYRAISASLSPSTSQTKDSIIRSPEDAQKALKKAKDADTAVAGMFSKVVKLCKIHGIPLDSRGRCLQKGCKYA